MRAVTGRGSIGHRNPTLATASDGAGNKSIRLEWCICLCIFWAQCDGRVTIHFQEFFVEFLVIGTKDSHYSRSPDSSEGLGPRVSHRYAVPV